MDKLIELRIDAHSPPDRVRTWKALLDENLMGVECCDAGDDLQVSVEGRHVDSGSVSRAHLTRQTMSRTQELIRGSAEETILLAFVQDGVHCVRQGHVAATLDGSGLYILDSSQPFEVNFVSPEIRQTALIVPKAAVTRRIGTIEDLAFNQETALQALVTSFALGMAEALDTLDTGTLDALLNQTLDLFALMVAERRRGAIAPSTHRAGTLLRLKAYIKARLHDEGLNLEQTAKDLGISSRYVNTLLAMEDTSFGRYVLTERLEGARREIMDPRLMHKQVTEVAFDWGFKDASHFGRAFKEKFGLTPRDAKHGERP